MEEIDKAKSGINIQAYSFTSKPIARAIADAHNKIMIIDQETVITGSFNFTKAAEESNAENVLIIRNKDLADRYLNNWQLHRRHSEVYKERQGN